MGNRCMPFIVNGSFILWTKNGNDRCHQCRVKFDVGDRVVPAGGKNNKKYYHERCYKEY